jgi:hypothetical protein
MVIRVQVDPTDEGYRAEGPFSLNAEGATRDEALDKLKTLIANRMSQGSELVDLETDDFVAAWKKSAGIYKNDPHMAEYRKFLEEHRAEVEADPNI